MLAPFSPSETNPTPLRDNFVMFRYTGPREDADVFASILMRMPRFVRGTKPLRLEQKLEARGTKHADHQKSSRVYVG